MDVLTQQLLNGATTGMTLALIALGINLIFGLFNFVNFAHGAFYVLGGYLAITAMSSLGMNYWVALVLVAICCGLLGMVLDFTIFQRILGRDPNESMILTFGLALVIEETIRLTWGPTPRNIRSPLSEERVSFLGLYLNAQLLFALIGSFVVIGLISLLIARTTFGLRVRAMTQDFEMAQLNGVRVKNLSAGVWFLGAATTGLAGIMILPAFTLETSGILPTAVMAFAVVIIGGLGSMWGSVVAGLLLGLSTSLVEAYLATGMTDITAYSLLLIALWLRPQGLAGKKVAA
ncbi:branched-chain amino acid ABC transporter permease [Nocardioides sp. AE5]|uniref:branched-chain amino acid ABC transporter permease n=1 Tax=Nocardioides sp. AE5 TaxID=2962573 RepID=UPI002880C114|nr:branched-chain amino acid ABC transporter permease [Nocardioides sp. AE5]MDT0200462.1 branched-chain amino acid ABC transporter permease [Nocardioides sp. AE5]